MNMSTYIHVLYIKILPIYGKLSWPIKLFGKMGIIWYHHPSIHLFIQAWDGQEQYLANI